jgi:hypothetical protein
MISASPKLDYLTAVFHGGFNLASIGREAKGSSARGRHYHSNLSSLYRQSWTEPHSPNVTQSEAAMV